MTKNKKGSLKGRGVDILLGGTEGGEEPGTATPASEESSIETPLSDADAEAMAADMSAGGGAAAQPDSAGEPNPFADVNPFDEPDAYAESASSVQPDPFAEPFAEGAETGTAMPDSAFEGEAVHGQPSTPVSTSLPPEEDMWLADETPPIADVGSLRPAESSGPVSVTLPSDPTLRKQPTIGGLSMSFQPIEDAGSFEPPVESPGAGFKVEPVTIVKQRLSDEEVARKIGPERVEALSKRIDDLYSQVAGGAITGAATAGECMLYLRKARDKELEDPRQYDEAEYLVNVAAYMVTHATQVRQWSYTYGTVIFIYGLIWLGLFSAALVLDELLVVWFRTFNPSVPATAQTMMDVFAPYETIVWGGVGGILGLLYSLYKHVSNRDFDRQFVIWYFIQPFMGMLTGAIVHLFIVAGLFTLLGAESEAFKAFGALAAIAFAFRQNYLYAWLEALVKRLQPGNNGTKSEDGQLDVRNEFIVDTSVGVEPELDQAQG